MDVLSPMLQLAVAQYGSGIVIVILEGLENNPCCNFFVFFDDDEDDGEGTNE